MESDNFLRRNLPNILWIAVIVSIYFVLSSLIAPFSDGITLSSKIVGERLQEIGSFLFAILGGLAIIEIYFYQIFFRQPLNRTATIITRAIQVAMGLLTFTFIIYFFNLTDLIKLGDSAIGKFVNMPVDSFANLQKSLISSKVATKDSAKMVAGIIFALGILVLYAIIQFTSKPRNSRVGLAYLLIMPAFIGVLFLIIYPFLFEIKLAFSNASLGTQATKNAQYSLLFGWENLKTLFTGTVAKDAKFFEVFWRTILWTVINVTFHVLGGMGLAILLNRPLKFKGLYRTLLVIPWAIPTTIAAMALRSEFDSRYGLFNILLGNLNTWLTTVSQNTANIIGIGNGFAWLAATIGPVSWKQDPFWAFVSVLIANIWLGIPFMSVIILGGLQSISQEYYEAAEIDGATRWQQFRNITLPLLRPVLTPAIILGVVWTFNKFDIIYLITQGGPQEKTDILVSSMYKAAFQFYRYGFTAMFALVIFAILFIFTLFYLRVSDGLKSATE
ncbi:MAG TPA: sugar ABC transporter permease [Anaerolineales bacterium]|nr:sugar ABC transporter permease [Anaerolineales bacterium]HMV97414.1 sugar ABC transporter permease [Anaerolineales bacterium]HMX20927.1 sugar ABC transporter permease [Anaerolineales bacterium]HMX75459.1 sugar ABC transporter permease [Anaerolineales bacterium]HMZ44527.1 sugar ABC transporter permease [Anaerolineales bacterium]